jgi:hypothetical protein
MTPAGTMSSMRSIALEECSLAVAGLVGLERDLGDAAAIGLVGGGLPGAFRSARRWDPSFHN